MSSAGLAHRLLRTAGPEAHRHPAPGGLSRHSCCAREAVGPHGGSGARP